MSLKNLMKKTRNSLANQIINIDRETVFIVSYPRSGNTWTRMLICNLLYPEEEIDFDKKEIMIPGFSLKKSLLIRKLEKPRIITSHQNYQRDWPRIIYILRDPRDVMVSLYHYMIRGNKIKNKDFNAFVRNYLIWPGENTWQFHVKSWLLDNQIDSKNFLILRYEKMNDDPDEQVEKIARFLKLDRTKQQISNAVEKSSFKQLRYLEAKEAGKIKDEKKRFYRKGCSNQWQEYFKKGTLEMFNSKVKPVEEMLSNI